MFLSIVCVCSGACAGALLRWLANIMLNPLFPALPFGTLAVNWLGGLLMGCALGFFACCPGAPAQWKLFIITGFLGSLTTFSAFSGEMAALLSQGRIWLCAAGICLHVFGSVAMVFIGIGLFGLLKKLAA